MVRKRKIADVSEEKEKESMGLEGGGGARKRFVGVRQRPSGRWVAEIKDTIQKIRVWLGTFDTAEAAARAYDEAACLLRGANTRTNFWPCSPAQPPPASVLPTKITNLLLLRLQTSRNSQEKDDAFADAAAAAASNADGDGRDKKGEEEDVKEASRSSSSSEEEEEEEQVVVDDVGDDMDFGFLDSSEGTCFYSPFEMAEEIEEEMPVLVDEEVGEGGGGDEPSILRAAMKRMKYERKISASLYALNGISECLRLRLQSYTSSNCNTSDGVQQQLNKEDDDGARHVQPEGSTSSSSNSNDDGERSMWSSLDLPSMHLFS